MEYLESMNILFKGKELVLIRHKKSKNNNQTKYANGLLILITPKVVSPILRLT